MQAQTHLFSLIESPRRDFVDEIAAFAEFGKKTQVIDDGAIRYFYNEFWTSRQRQAHSIHEISYRACFKAELPRFIIQRLTVPGAKGLEDFQMHEEWYSLKNFAPDLHVILVQDTVGMRNLDYERPSFPATWAREHGNRCRPFSYQRANYCCHRGQTT